jgi:hypothetical protein
MTVTPLLQPSAGRSRVDTAVELMNQAQRLLWAEQREREKRRREFKVAPYSEREQALINKAEARRIKQQHMISVDRAWFWNFSAEALDALRELAAEAKKHGQQMRADSIESRVDAACQQLDRLQQREAAR